jgi:2-methylcitrate dehydratase PrpD
LVGGGFSSAQAAARFHGTIAADSDRLDHLLGGQTGVGAVCAAWAFSKQKRVDDLLLATAAANEVSGRVGASMLLGPHYGAGAGWVHAVSAAVSAGRLLGLDGDKMAHCIALALSSAGPIPRATLASSGRGIAVGLAVGHGLEAAQLAKRGVTAPLGLLDSPGGLLELSTWLPLHHAFTGLGEAWLTQTLSFPKWPGPPAWHSSLDGVAEVLARHLKAADKRLRADQVRQIVVRVPAPAIALDRWMTRHGLQESAGLGHSIRHAIGALVVDHELGMAQLSNKGWAERSERYGSVARHVQIEHDIGLTMDLMNHMVDAAAPLIGGVTEGEWRGLLGRIEVQSAGWSEFKWADLLTVARHRPDQWFKRIRYAARDLGDGHLDQWQFKMGSGIVIKTTRGGSWPEKRVIAEGGPGSPWEPLIESVITGFSAGDPARLKSGRDVFDSVATGGSQPWVESLLA